MATCGELLFQIAGGAYDGALRLLYPNAAIAESRTRYGTAVTAFQRLFGDREVILVSAPGRTEIGGNHTDHQNGNVLAAAVDLDVLCVCAANGSNVIRIQSQGYPRDEVELSDLSVRPGEAGGSCALIRGVAAWFRSNGKPVAGFDAYTTSTVLGGSGLSSSAAFEVAVGNMLGALCGGATPMDIALAGQYAENNYFGKPSGLMDQTASSVGGFVRIDFECPGRPRIKPVAFDLAEHGLRLCIVSTGGSHADLTGDYAAITEEMGRVAGYFGEPLLRRVDESAFWAALPDLRQRHGERAVLRAIHFFRDNRLAVEEAEALERGDVDGFLARIIRSGRSSLSCLQNVFSPARPEEQGLGLALELSEGILDRKGGAWRVHGGGFAGTIQAFVPVALLAEYRERMEAVFGVGSCRVLSVRPVGGMVVAPG